MLPQGRVLRTLLVGLLLGSMGAVVGGCSATLSSPTASPSGEQAPVNLRELQITSVEGHRAVLLRLSRLPTLVRYSSSSNPGRITIQAWGPVGDGDLPERVLPQDDPQVAQVRVSRQEGGLRVVLDLKSDEPPAHTVHEMADWIMVRLTESGS